MPLLIPVMILSIYIACHGPEINCLDVALLTVGVLLIGLLIAMLHQPTNKN